MDKAEVSEQISTEAGLPVVFEEMGVVTVGELKPSISGKRSFRPSSSIRHATEW